MAETIVSKSYKIATDSSGNNWDKVSIWKKADDVKRSDNTTSLESTVGNIKGIANNLTTTEEGYALDARQGAVLAAMFGGLTFGLGIPEEGEEAVWGYTTPEGTFVPFGGIEEMKIEDIVPIIAGYRNTSGYIVSKNYKYIMITAGDAVSLTGSGTKVINTAFYNGGDKYQYYLFKDVALNSKFTCSSTGYGMTLLGVEA